MVSAIKTAYKYALKSPFFLFGSYILVILASLTSNATNFIYSDITEKVQNNDINAVYSLAAILAATFFANMVISNIGRIAIDKYCVEASRNMRIDVMNHLHALDFSYHAKKSSGSLISKFKRGDGALFTVLNELNDGILRLIIDFIIISVTFLTLGALCLHF